MRENIGLYRGKRLDNGEWVEGWLVIKKDPVLEITYCFILAYGEGESFVTWYPVDPETVGQYTGLTDKSGKKIFEGDIIESNNEMQSAIFVVKYGEYTPKMFYALYDAVYGWTPTELFYGFFFEAKGEQMIVVKSKYLEVIGNIHDNPELLGGNGP